MCDGEGKASLNALRILEALMFSGHSLISCNIFV